MPLTIRPYRRLPVHCSVTYNAGPFLKLPLAYLSGFWSLITLLVLSSGPAYAEWVAVAGKEKGSGVFVGVPRPRARHCVAAPASVESLHVDLLS